MRNRGLDQKLTSSCSASASSAAEQLLSSWLPSGASGFRRSPTPQAAISMASARP